MSKENTDLYGDKIEKSTYTPTAEEIKKKEKQDKIKRCWRQYQRLHE